MSTRRSWKRRVILAAIAGLIGLTAGPALAGELLKPGQKAPPFEMMSDRDEPVRLDAFRGKHWVLLAFYPKAFTPG